MLPRPRRFAFLLALSADAAFALSCSVFNQPPPPTPGECDALSNPRERDLEYALGFPGDAFSQSRWSSSFTAQPGVVSATWLSEDLNAVAHINYLIYDCGFSQEDMDLNFGEENIVGRNLTNYSDATTTATCRESGGTLALHEFSATLDNIPYQVRLWVLPRGETRVLSLSLVFPASDPAALNAYAQRLFPGLPTCGP